MEKVLVAIDANQVNMNVLDFACYIAKLTHSKLTGVLLDNTEALPVIDIISGISDSTFKDTTEQVKKKHSDLYKCMQEQGCKLCGSL